MAMPVKTKLLEWSKGHRALANPLVGAKRHPNELQEGEEHSATWCATSQFHPTQNGNNVPYKCYGTYSNEVLPKYFSNTTNNTMQTSLKADTSISGAKKHPNESKGPMVMLVIPMLQNLMKEGPQYTITSADWGKCVLYVAGQRKPGQLNSRQAKAAEIHS